MGYKRSPEKSREDRSGGTFGPLNLLTIRAIILGRGGASIVSDNFDLDTGYWGRLLDLSALVGWFAASFGFDLENLDLTLLYHFSFTSTGGFTFPFPLFCVLGFRRHLQITIRCCDGCSSGCSDGG